MDTVNKQENIIFIDDTKKLKEINKKYKEENEEKPVFDKLTLDKNSSKNSRSLRVPPNRYSALKKEWERIYTPIVEKMELQIRMNPKKKMVELKTSEYTTQENAIQKATDFINAFLLGFEISDAVALLRLDDIFVESFEIKDVKTLEGDHLGRAIGRIAGKNGSTKFTIENATKTRIVLADTKVHVLGAYENIQNAKNAISDLILGSPPGQVYNKLRILSARMKESF
eukprot:gene5759-9580_t